MSNFKPTGLIILIAGSFFFASCEKVINVDLNNAAKKYVIEGIVSDKAGQSKVLLSTTKNFDENNSFVGVSGASVTVTDNLGNVTTFMETATGIYSAPALVAISGKTYSLNVVANGNTFTAVSTMPQKMIIDTVFASDELLFGSATKLVNYAYQDPIGKGNGLRFVEYINGLQVKTIFLRDDDYTDGNYVQSKLWYMADDNDDKFKIKQGDKVDVDIFCISPDVYKYWFSLEQSATGASQSASPANPVSNIKGGGGALGYFSAQTYQTKSFIVP